MFKLLGLFLLSLSVWCPGSQGSPQLLVSKMILNEFVVEGKDLTIQYSLYNVGTSPALSVKLEDNSFTKDEFTVVNGLLTAKWDKINQNSNVTHMVVMTPLSSGHFNMSWASVRYSSTDGEEKAGFSSAPGVVPVIRYPDFSRIYENHLMEWLAFVVMSAPTVLLPFLMWYRSHSKYEDLKTKKA